jgi:hypothetical protein
VRQAWWLWLLLPCAASAQFDSESFDTESFDEESFEFAASESGEGGVEGELSGDTVTIRFTLLINECDGSLDTDFPDGDKCESETVEPLTLGLPVASLSTEVRVPRTANCTGGTLPYTYFIERGADPASFFPLSSSLTLFDGTGFVDTLVDPDTSYHYRAYCIDAAAEQSDYSNIVVATTPAENPDDETAPTTPANCVANAAVKTISTLGLTCDASTDAVGVDGYNCIIGTATAGPDTPVAFLKQHSSQTPSCLFTDLDESQHHYMRMSAFDEATNVSGASTRVYDTTSTDTPVPDGNILFKENFNDRPSPSTYLSVPGVWNTGSSNPNGQCSFQHSNPPVAGSGKYLRCGPVTKAGANVFRTEYKYVGPPSFQSPTSLGDGHNVSPTFWYGYKFCLDQYTTGSGPHGMFHIDQWHDVADAPFSPKISLMGNAQELRVYMEKNLEAPPVNTGGFTGANIITPVLYTGHLGTCINVIWQVKWDTRVSAASAAISLTGSTGLARLWLGSSSTPVFEWVNKMTQHKIFTPPHATWGTGDFGIPYFPLGGYLSCWRTDCVPEGTVYESRYDNFTVMDETGSWAAMNAELNAAN